MIERVEAEAAPPPAGKQEGGGEDDRAAAPLGERRRSERDRDDSDDGGRHANGQRSGQPGAQPGGEQMRRGHPRQELHRSTRSRSSASRAGPMPGTASSSSTEPKAPWAVR